MNSFIFRVSAWAALMHLTLPARFCWFCLLDSEITRIPHSLVMHEHACSNPSTVHADANPQLLGSASENGITLQQILVPVTITITANSSDQ